MNEIYFEGSKAVKAEAEEAVIGSVLTEPECFSSLADLSADDFYYHRHRAVWQIFRYLADTDQPLDLPTITSALQDAGKIEEVGGPTFLVNLASGTLTAANARHYADTVKKAATLRRGIETVDRLQNKLADASPEEAEKVLDEATKALEEARPDASRGLKHVSEIEDEVFGSLERDDDRVLTGFPEFDKFSKGLKQEDLYILAGRPSVGKTAKMLQMAYGVAQQEKGAVLIWSQEMSRVDILLRMLSAGTEVPYNFLTKDKDKLAEKYKKKLREKYKEMNQLPIYVDDAAGKSIYEIKAAIKSFKARKGKIAAVFVDYLQIMKMPYAETRALAIGKVTGEAKQIAKKEKLTFVMLSQLNRKTEDEKPNMSHLKESGAIEQDADVIEFLYEHVNDLEEPAPFGEKWVRSLIAKGRNIGTTEIKCSFAGWCQKYTEIRVVPPGEDERKTSEGKDKKKKGAA